MFKYKQLIIGLLVGSSMMFSIQIFAEDGLQKIEAYLRPNLPITLNGQKVKLESPPVMVDGSTYLRLRDVSKLTGVNVSWDEKSQTVVLSTYGSNPTLQLLEVPSPTPTNSPNSKISSTDSTALLGENIVYYLASDVNAKYPPTSSRVLDDGRVLWTINGKEINQREIMTKKDSFHVDGTNKVYWSKDYFSHYLTDEQLSEFQKFSIDFNTKVVTPIS